MTIEIASGERRTSQPIISPGPLWTDRRSPTNAGERRVTSLRVHMNRIYQMLSDNEDHAAWIGDFSAVVAALRRQPVTEEMVKAADEMRQLFGPHLDRKDRDHNGECSCRRCGVLRGYDTARAKVGK